MDYRDEEVHQMACVMILDPNYQPRLRGEYAARIFVEKKRIEKCAAESKEQSRPTNTQ